MATVKIKLFPVEKMGYIHFGKEEEPVKQALVNGLYTECAPIETDFTGEDAAEEMFDLTNNPSRQGEREEKYGRGRSLSVGDIVVTDDGNFLCKSFGWKKL